MACNQQRGAGWEMRGHARPYQKALADVKKRRRRGLYRRKIARDGRHKGRAADAHEVLDRFALVPCQHRPWHAALLQKL